VAQVEEAHVHDQASSLDHGGGGAVHLRLLLCPLRVGVGEASARGGRVGPRVERSDDMDRIERATMSGRVNFELVSTWDPGFVAAIRAHYTRSRGAPPGKKLAWRVFVDSAHFGWIGAGEPAFKLAPRRRLGLADARPAERTVSNFIFRVDGGGGARSSEVLRAWLVELGRAWELRYGWRPEHVETLVDPDEVGRGAQGHVAGYCFRRAGFRALGMTTGRSARRPPGSTHGARVWASSTPKLVLYWGPLARVELR